MYSDVVWLRVRKCYSEQMKQIYNTIMEYNNLITITDHGNADPFGNYFANEVYSQSSDTSPSVRKIARKLGSSQRSLARIVKEDIGLRACSIAVQPKLTDTHKQARTKFGYWVHWSLPKASIRKILFTDKKYFTLDVIFKPHNERVYTATRAATDECVGLH